MSTETEQKKAAGYVVEVTAVIAGKKRNFIGLVLCTGGWSEASGIALNCIGEVERMRVVCKPLTSNQLEEAA